MLHVERWGSGPRVGLIHGFTQSAAAWAPLAERLSDRWELAAVDAPGHGRSAGIDAGLWEAAAMIGDTIGEATYVGYSMGGRIALHLALARPDMVRRLVLVSATAGIDDASERAARRAADEQLAARVETDGLEAFVAWWLRRPLFATLSPEASALESRMGGTASGLASSLRRAGTGTQQPLWGRLGELAMPVLVVAGALDEAYAERAHRLGAGIGASSTVEVIPGAGHACHLERPEEFAALLRDWLTATEAPPAP